MKYDCAKPLARLAWPRALSLETGAPMKGLGEQLQLFLCPFLTSALDGNFGESGARGGVRTGLKQNGPDFGLSSALHSPETAAPA